MILAALVSSGAAFYSGCASSRNKQDKGNLVIMDTDSARVYGEWSLEEPKEFAIEFIHSVNKSPVRDYFKIEGNLIRLVATRFHSFGAGIKTDLDEGQTLIWDGDALVISGFTASFKELNLIIGPVTDHLLFINGECISLRNLCGRNAHITISFK